MYAFDTCVIMKERFSTKLTLSEACYLQSLLDYITFNIEKITLRYSCEGKKTVKHLI